MTDKIHLNQLLSPLVSFIHAGHFGNANRNAADLLAQAERWRESLFNLRRDARADRDEILRDKPAGSPDFNCGEWADFDQRCKDAYAKVEALSELHSAVIRLSEALRRIADESSNRVCDREDAAHSKAPERN